jgi:small ligand-binding sensory domain FIST
MFTSGARELIEPLALAVANSPYKSVPCLFVPSPSILSDAGEIESGFACTGAAWSSGQVEVAVADSPAELAARLKPGGSLLVFADEEGGELDLGPLLDGRRAVFGATLTAAPALATDGAVTSGRLAALRFDDGFSPVVESSSAAAIVSEPYEVTATDGAFLLELDGAPALDVLTEATGGGKHRGLVMVRVEPATDATAASSTPSTLDLRPVRGVDPGRRAFALRGTVRRGARISFVVRDPATARQELEEAVRRTDERSRGSQPMLGLYVSCVGRQRSLYGESDAELRMIRKRFPKLPLAGLFAPQQLVPVEGGAELRYMASVLALFRAPS